MWVVFVPAWTPLIQRETVSPSWAHRLARAKGRHGPPERQSSLAHADSSATPPWRQPRGNKTIRNNKERNFIRLCLPAQSNRIPWPPAPQTVVTRLSQPPDATRSLQAPQRASTRLGLPPFALDCLQTPSRFSQHRLNLCHKNPPPPPGPP